MLKKLRQKLEKNGSININLTEALELMNLKGYECVELFSFANHIRSNLGDRIDLCSIVNAKCGLCPEDCKFCAQSVHSDTQITPYPMMNEEEILNIAQMMEEEGAARFCIVTSGKEVNGEDFESILSTIRRIRKETGLSICISSGVLTEERALALKSAGTTRIHHNLETSRNFFNKICTTHTYDEKIGTIHTAKKAGLEICCGGIIGMGESVKDRLELAFTLKELDIDSIPINILNPIEGTPINIYIEKSIKPLEILKTISVFRLILPEKNIRIAGGREKNLRDLQGLCLLAGANGLLLGNYLTTQGRVPGDDIRMINDLELIPGGVHV